MRWKIFQWMKLLFRHSSNSRKLSRQKFHNELACVFTAHYASKNADWNQQQLTDGGVLANRNSANHPYCFLFNQKKVQILAFLHVICERNVSCLPKTDYRDKGRGHDHRLHCSALRNQRQSCAVGWFPFRLRNSPSLQLFEVDRDCDRELAGGASLALTGFSESKMWALGGSLWHNSEPDQVATAHLC